MAVHFPERRNYWYALVLFVPIIIVMAFCIVFGAAASDVCTAYDQAKVNSVRSVQLQSDRIRLSPCSDNAHKHPMRCPVFSPDQQRLQQDPRLFLGCRLCRLSGPDRSSAQGTTCIAILCR
jgi:hypothetical protein